MNLLDQLKVNGLLVKSLYDGCPTTSESITHTSSLQYIKSFCS